MLHQSAFLLALRNASPGTECASRTSLPHFLVDRPFAVVWLHFSWRPIGGTPFMRLAAHCLETRPRTEGADFGICQTFAASPAEPGELPCWFRLGAGDILATNCAPPSFPETSIRLAIQRRAARIDAPVSRAMSRVRRYSGASVICESAIGWCQAAPACRGQIPGQPDAPTGAQAPAAHRASPPIDCS